MNGETRGTTELNGIQRMAAEFNGEKRSLQTFQTLNQKSNPNHQNPNLKAEAYAAGKDTT